MEIFLIKTILSTLNVGKTYVLANMSNKNRNFGNSLLCSSEDEIVKVKFTTQLPKQTADHYQEQVSTILSSP